MVFISLMAYDIYEHNRSSHQIFLFTSVFPESDRISFKSSDRFFSFFHVQCSKYIRLENHFTCAHLDNLSPAYYLLVARFRNFFLGCTATLTHNVLHLGTGTVLYHSVYQPSRASTATVVIPPSVCS